MTGCWPGTRPVSSHLDRTGLANREGIIWLSGKFFFRDGEYSKAGRKAPSSQLRKPLTAHDLVYLACSRG